MSLAVGTIQILNANGLGSTGYPLFAGSGTKTIKCYVDAQEAAVPFSARIMTGDWASVIVPNTTLGPTNPQEFSLTGQFKAGSYVVIVDSAGKAILWEYFEVSGMPIYIEPTSLGLGLAGGVAIGLITGAVIWRRR